MAQHFCRLDVVSLICALWAYFHIFNLKGSPPQPYKYLVEMAHKAALQPVEGIEVVNERGFVGEYLASSGGFSHLCKYRVAYILWKGIVSVRRTLKDYQYPQLHATLLRSSRGELRYTGRRCKYDGTLGDEDQGTRRPQFGGTGDMHQVDRFFNSWFHKHSWSAIKSINQKVLLFE